MSPLFSYSCCYSFINLKYLKNANYAKPSNANISYTPLLMQLYFTEIKE